MVLFSVETGEMNHGNGLQNDRVDCCEGWAHWDNSLCLLHAQIRAILHLFLTFSKASVVWLTFFVHLEDVFIIPENTYHSHQLPYPHCDVLGSFPAAITHCGFFCWWFFLCGSGVGGNVPRGRKNTSGVGKRTWRGGHQKTCEDCSRGSTTAVWLRRQTLLLNGCGDLKFKVYASTGLVHLEY